jgi:hypothetical protein
MKALSIQQPWAWAILHAGKDIENRTWPTSIRGSVLIHAGLKIDFPAFDWIEKRFGIRIPRLLRTGGIVGCVDIVNCVMSSNSKWFTGKYGFVLQNPIETSFVHLSGKLKFFETNVSLVPDVTRGRNGK